MTVAQCVELAGLDVGDVKHSKSSYLSILVTGEAWLCANKTGAGSNEAQHCVQFHVKHVAEKRVYSKPSCH
jgi:hypothetical protein